MIAFLRSPSHRSSCARRDTKGGFTLVELLVVLVILGLVMGLAGPRVLGYLSSSRDKAAKLQIESFAAALDLFYLDNGRYPSTSEGLQSLVQRPPAAENWSGPYLKQGSVPPDPWGRPYEYRTPGKTAPYAILSLGAEGVKGGANVIGKE
ncbi:type II secretion system major pseudopilin GspG [Methylobacterium iners]|uniref:Type II secretion system core protein G n=1 Tax=Methylobacterium iners TaxID=418707 RepID=A0ABQ4S0L2_9HYPH|nr:type II secretion system major pseudopilin GspG [Methylobacterium iners]GJD96624.1 Type II secretion system protein G [Methylobacterium iners]